MTIIDLIEKLKEEVYKQMDAGKESNGAYGVLEEWYKEMLTLNPSQDYDRFDEHYHRITGLIWGLRAAYYITQEEKDQLIEDLNWINSRFYNLNDMIVESFYWNGHHYTWHDADRVFYNDENDEDYWMTVPDDAY